MTVKYQNYSDKNKNLNRGFRKLEVWQEAIELFVFIDKAIKVNDEISYKVKAQIIDSALSISSNIAEGYCRRHLKENIQFLNYSLGSLGENYSQIFALLNSESIKINWFEEYDAIHYKLENKLLKLIQSYIAKIKVKGSWNKDFYIKELIEDYKS